MRKIVLLISLVTIPVFIGWVGIRSSKSAPQHLNYQQVKDSTDKQTQRFNPGFVNARHHILRFQIKDYEIEPIPSTQKKGTISPLDPTKARSVVGEFPKMRPGPFEVVFRDGSRTVLRYTMRSPLFHRVESGPGKGLFRVKAGFFEVPVPNSLVERKSLTIILSDNERKVYENRVVLE